MCDNGVSKVGDTERTTQQGNLMVAYNKNISLYINDAFNEGYDINSIRNGVYDIVTTAIKNNNLRIKPEEFAVRGLDNTLFAQQNIHIDNVDFYLAYIYNTYTKDKDMAGIYAYNLDANLKSVMDVRDKKNDKSVLTFSERQFVFELFDMIQKKCGIATR